MRRRTARIIGGGIVGAGVGLAVPGVAAGQTAEPLTAEAVQAVMDNVWVFVAGCLVFFMQAGFSFVEAGLTRSKNVVNIMAKNMADMIIGVLAFFAVGYAFAFGGGNDWFGDSAFFLSGQAPFEIGSSGVGTLTSSTFFFFQVVFAATAVTIVSGAMAERTKFVAYLLFAAVMCSLIYPPVVHWTWGGGLIAKMSIGDAVYSDFAGSSIVHMTGGVAALMGAWFVGARRGKYDRHGNPRAIPGHSIPYAIIGVFILWLGWFGFNPGSELAADTSVMFIGVNTLVAAAAGGLATTVVVWVKSGKPDVAMIGNGVLAGLVGITAGTGTVSFFGAFVIGAAAGVIVVYAVLFFDRVRIDDPVGAISVHGVCGVWGTLALGLFARYDDGFLGRENAGLFYGGGFDQLAMQTIMVVIIAAWVAATSGVLFLVVKNTVGLRVDADEEESGLDLPEHGMHGYTVEAAL